MKRKPEREFLTRWVPTINRRGLIHCYRMLRDDAPWLIHGYFVDAQGDKCLASWFGHYLGMSGPEFLKHCGITGESEVVNAWDNEPELFRSQMLKALRLEIFYRKGGRT